MLERTEWLLGTSIFKQTLTRNSASAELGFKNIVQSHDENVFNRCVNCLRENIADKLCLLRLSTYRQRCHRKLCIRNPLDCLVIPRAVRFLPRRNSVM